MGRLVKLLATVALLALSLGVSACGGDGGGTTTSTTSTTGATGGEIKVGTVGPDSYDPVLNLTLQAYQPLQLAYTALLTFKHVEGDAGAEIIPALAESLPEKGDGGKTYKLRLRSGVEYSDGTPVKASDFENTVKRLLKLAGPFSSFVTPIVGAPEFQKKGDFKADIPGIETNDKTGQITIKLTEADTKFDYALAEIWTAPTPAAKSPAKSLTKAPPPGAGPYVLDVVDPSREFVLTRNENFSEIPGVPKGNFDKITGVVTDSIPRMTQDVIKGKLDFMTEDPAGDLLPEVREKYADRYRQDANPPNVYYFFLNVTVPPFDKLEARQAVNYAVDSRALVRIFGGRLEPGCTFLSPGVVGFDEQANANCPYGDPNGPGDVAKAKQLVEKSGTKGQTVTVWTNNKDPRPAIGEYLADLLREIGYKTKLKTLDQKVYFEQIGLKKTEAQIGFTDWFQDFPHPSDFIQANLTSLALESEPTYNAGFVSDKRIDSENDKLKASEPKDVADQWAELDKYLIGPGKAYIVPYGYEESSSFFSERMGFENCAGVHPVYKNDWSLFCLK